MKEKRIVRTIKLTTAKIMFADMETQTMKAEDRDLVGSFKNDKDILSYINISSDSPVQAIKVLSSYEREEKRYMLESAFYNCSRLQSENN